MLETLSHAEYIDWVARFSIEPFPLEREDLRNAMLMTLIANANAGKGQKFTIEQFIIDFWGKQQQQTPQEILQNAQILNALLNKKKSSA